MLDRIPSTGRDPGRSLSRTAFPFGKTLHAGVLFHPDYTVGPGITPDLLTPPNRAGARGLMPGTTEAGPPSKHRRWGLAPRPENVSATY